MTFDVIIDGFSHRYGGGITYLAGLLPQLIHQPRIRRVRLIVEPDADVAHRLVDSAVDVELVRLRPAGSVVSRAIWEALVLPRRARGSVLIAPAAMLPRRVPAPVVAVPHNALPFQVRGARPTLQCRAIVRTLRWATAAIFVSAHMRRLVASAATLPVITRVVPHGIDSVFLASPDPSIQREGIISIADAYPHKRLGLLVDAWRALGPHRPSLHLVGRRLSGAPLPQPGLSFASNIAPAEVAMRLQTAALAVLPSANESFGLPALEALASRTPLIASDIPAYREATGGNAVLVSGDRPEVWSEAMAKVLARPPDSRPGYEWAKHFTWARCARATATVLGEAVDAYYGRSPSEKVSGDPL